jgi:hypothetical protein
MAEDLIVQFLIANFVGIGYGTDGSFYVFEDTKINLANVYFICHVITCIGVPPLSH